MPLVAEAVGFDPAAGTMTTSPATGVRVELGADGWATLVLPDVGSWPRPVDGDWARLSLEYGNVVLAVGYTPMQTGLDPLAYLDEVLASNAYVLGLVPVTGPHPAAG